MRILLLVLLLTSSLASIATPNQPPYHATLSKVYICNGSNSYAYHRTDRCSGLEYCTREVKRITVAEAQNMGRWACKKCY